MAKLLLVDDELILLSALERILSDAGHQVTAMSSGAKAISALATPDGDFPDVIITDVLMQDIDGLKLFSIVRQNPMWQDIPFIFISASVTPQIEELIQNSNRTMFLRKPFEVERLLLCINQAVANT